MKNTHLRLLILFGTAVLTGLFIIQLYWFRSAFNAEAKQFDHTVQVALMRVADSVSAHSEVKKLSANFYFVATESNFDSKAVDSLLKWEFRKRNLLLEYELGVYDAEDDTLVYGQYVEATKKHQLQPDMLDRKRTENIKNFAVYFPRKKSYVTAQMDVWIFSTVALLLMVCFFGYAIATLLRERRYAEMKSDFINNMTHEFKTPVTNIGITGEIIRKKTSEESGVHVYVDILLKENEKLRKKIEQVLLGSSMDQQRRHSMDRFDVHQLIAECAEPFQFKIMERNGVLKLHLDASSAFISGDRELLAQAINNVIDNAEKYSLESPYIVVETVDNEKAIEIRIADKGIGIPEGSMTKVFEKFFRVQRGDVHNVKGFGLGLTFVKSVIQAHRGRVRLFSSENAGTQVKIILPKA